MAEFIEETGREMNNGNPTYLSYSRECTGGYVSNSGRRKVSHEPDLLWITPRTSNNETANKLYSSDSMQECLRMISNNSKCQPHSGENEYLHISEWGDTNVAFDKVGRCSTDIEITLFFLPSGRRLTSAIQPSQ